MAHFKNTEKQNSPESVATKPVNILKDEGSSGNSSVTGRILLLPWNVFHLHV